VRAAHPATAPRSGSATESHWSPAGGRSTSLHGAVSWLTWTGQAAADVPTVFPKNTLAEGIVNVLIVVGGSLVALVIAMASPTYQAWSEWLHGKT
jgi:hypothetical protein